MGKPDDQRPGRRISRAVMISLASGAAFVCLNSTHDGLPSFTGEAVARDRGDGGDNDFRRSRDDMRRAQDADREARWQARQQAEQARRQAEQARRQAEQARRQNDNGDDAKPQDSGNDQSNDSGSQASGGGNGGDSGGASSNSNTNSGTAQGKDQTAASSGKSDSGGDGGKRNKGDVPDTDQPPATVADMFKQLFDTNSQPQSGTKPEIKAETGTAQRGHHNEVGDKAGSWQTKVSDSKGQLSGKGKAADVTFKPASGKPEPVKPAVVAAPAKPAAGQAAAAQPAVKAASAKQRGGGARDNYDFDSLRRPEVLAINSNAATLALAASKGFQVKDANTLSGLGMSVTRLLAPEGMSADEASQQIQKLSAEAKGGNFAPNQHYRIYKTATYSSPQDKGKPPASSDPAGPPCSGDHCYGRDVMGWNPGITTCAKSLSIGIIDTAVDITHPAFAKKSIDVVHLTSPGHEKGPDWHGTGVLAILAGDDTSDTPGLIPDASFYVADVFFSDSDGQPATDTMSLLRGIDWLKQKKVKIVNMSLSGPADDLVREAIEKLTKQDVIFVAAAGNEGPGSPPSYPAAYPPVIAVTAVNKDLVGYRYANQGSYIDLAAPGVSIWTAMPGAKEGYHSGTSFAAPYVTAALAAMYRRMPDKSKPAVLQQVSYRDLGPPGRDSIYGNGLLLAPKEQCGTSNVAIAPESVVSSPTALPAAPAPGFSFQSGSMAGTPKLESLPWLSGR